jgi:very-short-patch-repair endonuclease
MTTFDLQCRALGLPQPVAEFMFAKAIGRKWRFDFAWPEKMVALEIDGGTFIPGGGRHSRGPALRQEMEKFAEAAIMGWRVIRCLPEHVTKGVAVQWVERAIKGEDICR